MTRGCCYYCSCGGRCCRPGCCWLCRRSCSCILFYSCRWLWLWLGSRLSLSFTLINESSKSNHFSFISTQEAPKSNQGLVLIERDRISGVRTRATKCLANSVEGRHHNLLNRSTVPENIHLGYFLSGAKVPCRTIPSSI